MVDFSDKTAEVRKGEELDVAAVGKFLEDKAPELAGEIEVEQFPSGHSNLTYMVKIDGRELVLRRPPFGSKVKTAHDMGREFKVLSAISPVYSCAPKPLVFCEDDSVIGGQFYIMERFRGVVLRKELPEGLDFNSEIAEKLSESFVQKLADLHAIDYKACGLGDLGKPDGYMHRQVEGWAKRYDGSRTHEFPELESLPRWLRENLPESPAPALIHNDYKYDNLLLDTHDITKIVGVFDWEMATIGDPLSDLGGALGYWVQADDRQELKDNAFGPTYAPGSYSRRRLAERYAEITGRDVSNIHYYTVLANFKTAVILQQIYYRFNKGLTQDERFGPLIDMVEILGKVGAELIERGEI